MNYAMRREGGTSKLGWTGRSVRLLLAIRTMHEGIPCRGSATFVM